MVRGPRPTKQLCLTAGRLRLFVLPFAVLAALAALASAAVGKFSAHRPP
eukprot:SAG11_NODE_16661_length_541_cov_0.819005_1_plen_48_part_10